MVFSVDLSREVFKEFAISEIDIFSEAVVAFFADFPKNLISSPVTNIAVLSTTPSFNLS